jgi:hypothetical protein
LRTTLTPAPEAIVVELRTTQLPTSYQEVERLNGRVSEIVGQP